jgi:dephospho-CoA kinase
MFRVGLTGNVASGKSSVARVLSDAGAAVIDADALARRAVEPGSPGLEQVQAAFGDAVMDGEALDRAALRRLVFSDPEARRRLEAIVHPEVARLRQIEESRLRDQGEEIVVNDIPLLFEVGLADEFDMIVLVDAPRDIREDRLARDRGLSQEEAHAIVDAQMATAVKRGRADVVIDNVGTRAELEEAARRAWREIVRRAGSQEVPGAGRVRVDMHIHTRRSFDCLSDPYAVMKQSERVGLHRVCITDHNEIEAALELADHYPDRVIPGEEVRTAEGIDVIGLYTSEWIPKGTPAREACEQIHDQGGLVYLPHPFAGGKGGGGALLDQVADVVDVVEGFNARIHREELNERARDWARARSLPLGAGSDAHTLGEIGNAYVSLPAFNNEPRSFLAALQRATLYGSEAHVFVHVASTLAKLIP